jgi:YcxB-like protein
MSEEHFRITFQLGQKDVYRSNVAVAIDSVGRPRTIAGLVLIEVLAIAGLVGMVLRAKAAGAHESLFVSASIWGVVFFPTILLFTCYVLPYFGAKSLYKNNANVRSTIHWSFSEQLITQEMATGKAELSWSNFIKFRETADLFLLFPQKHLAFPLPKRAFADEKEIQAFRKLVRRHVRDSADRPRLD